MMMKPSRLFFAAGAAITFLVVRPLRGDLYCVNQDCER